MLSYTNLTKWIFKPQLFSWLVASSSVLKLIWLRFFPPFGHYLAVISIASQSQDIFLPTVKMQTRCRIQCWGSKKDLVFNHHLKGLFSVMNQTILLAVANVIAYLFVSGNASVGCSWRHKNIVTALANQTELWNWLSLPFRNVRIA